MNALWLKPSGDAYRALTRTIRELASAFGTPAFEPHLTLLAHLPGPAQEDLQRAEGLVRALNPFRVALTEPSYGDEYFRCVFMLVDPTPTLMRAHAVAERAFGLSGTAFRPHVSLSYGDWPLARKKEVIHHLPEDVRTSFEARSIYLIEADRLDPNDWREIAALPMGG